MRPLTTPEMVTQLGRLNDMWPKWKASDTDFKRFAHSYREALDGLDAEAVEGAVGMWIRTCTTNRWPAPAQLRELAGQWIAANRIDVKTVGLTDDAQCCRVCRAPPRWAVLRVTDYVTKDESIIERMIQPCLKDRHPTGSHYVPVPDNFVRWAPMPAPEVRAAGSPPQRQPPKQETDT